jgi:hypothetical protein
MLWAEIHGGRVLRYLLGVKEWHIISFLIFILMIFSFLVFKQKTRVVSFCIFTTGFSSMAFMLAVILAYQASYGYVYETIGILAATFMIGLWTGAHLLKPPKKVLRMLFSLEIMTIALALTSSIFFKAEFLFYVLNFILGVITGRQFNTANLFMNKPEIAGKLYGLDLIGSVLGAFIPAIIFIPLFGIPNTLFLVAGIKAVSAVMILSLVT